MSDDVPQCHGDCTVDEPHPETIAAGEVLCGACGRTRPAALYRLAESAHPLRIELLAFASRLGDVIRRIGVARTPESIKTDLEEIHNEMVRRCDR